MPVGEPQAYTELAPPPDLAAFVDRFWWQTRGRAQTGELHRVLPDGCVDALFYLDRGGAELVGTMTRALAFPAGPARRFHFSKARPAARSRVAR